MGSAMSLSDISRTTHRNAARIRMLNDRHGSVGVILGGTPRCVRIDVVVIGHILAVKLFGSRKSANLAVGWHIQSRRLMRVLAVAQCGVPTKCQTTECWPG